MQDILLTISSPEQTDTEGNRLVALKRHPNKFSGYPLKVDTRRSAKTIVTAYPLKKKYWR